MRKLEWREVVGARSVIGDVNGQHIKLLDFPGSLQGLSKPYVESNLGIENIFKVLRIDTLWRLSYFKQNTNWKFGIRAKLQLVF
ncbi:MAG: hypothetical protein HC896_16345 [Bacteroidales bacterium]|nr:hypothetical protein [Bacteroidales bacterium]